MIFLIIPMFLIPIINDLGFDAGGRPVDDTGLHAAPDDAADRAQDAAALADPDPHD
ncbi:MAG: hypothetical protein R2862_01255 [Thermoanaerobaculia bacterium]